MERVLPRVGALKRRFKHKGVKAYELEPGTPLPALVRRSQDTYWAKQDEGIRRRPAQLYLESYTELPTGLQLSVHGDSELNYVAPSLLFRHTFGSFLVGAGHGIFDRLYTDLSSVIEESPLELAKIDDVYIHSLCGTNTLGLPSFLLAIKEVRKQRKHRRREAQIPTLPKVIGPLGIGRWLRGIYELAGTSVLHRDINPFLHTHELAYEPALLFADKQRLVEEELPVVARDQLIKKVAAPGVGGHWQSVAHFAGKKEWAYVFQEAANTRFDPEKAKDLGVPDSAWSELKQGGAYSLPSGRLLTITDVSTTRSGRKIVVTGSAQSLDHISELAADADLLVQPESAEFGPKLAQTIKAKNVVLLPTNNDLPKHSPESFPCPAHLASHSWTFDLPERSE